ncbi:MAG: RNA polymerase sigma factor [Nitrososphaeraceae archaeon]|nr:RNA polymerase sigma factor [Nitrososphaeraceae archaeon]
MRNVSDQEIIDSVKKGNQADFSVLIDRYKDRAFSLLKRMLKNQFDAEEILQDCFLKTYNALNSFKGDSKFSTWFYRIVYNTALTKLSSKKRKIETEMASIDEFIDLENDSFSVNAETENTSEIINEIINKLPEKYSAIITMFYLNEMSCEEICEALNISVANVKVMLYRSRNAMKDFIIKNNLVKELR